MKIVFPRGKGFILKPADNVDVEKKIRSGQCDGLLDFQLRSHRRLRSRLFPLENSQRKIANRFKLVYFEKGKYTGVDKILQAFKSRNLRTARFRELVAFGSSFHLVLPIIISKDCAAVIALDVSKIHKGKRHFVNCTFQRDHTRLHLLQFSKDLSMANNDV